MGQSVSPPTPKLTSFASAQFVTASDPVDADTVTIGADHYVVDTMTTLSALVLAANIPGVSVTDRSISFTTPHGLVVGDSFKCVGPVDKGIAPTEVFRVLSVTSATVVVAKRNASGLAIAGGSAAFSTATAAIWLSDQPGQIVADGHIPLGISGAATPSQRELRYTLTDAVNTRGTEPVVAVDLGDTFARVVVSSTVSGSIALAALSGLNEWSSATLDGGRNVAALWTADAYVVTVVDMIIPALVVLPVAFTPRVVLAHFVDGLGVDRQYDGAMTIVSASGAIPAYVQFENGGVATYSNGDVLHYFMSE